MDSQFWAGIVGVIVGAVLSDALRRFSRWESYSGYLWNARIALYARVCQICAEAAYAAYEYVETRGTDSTRKNESAERFRAARYGIKSLYGEMDLLLPTEIEELVRSFDVSVAIYRLNEDPALREDEETVSKRKTTVGDRYLELV